MNKQTSENTTSSKLSKLEDGIRMAMAHALPRESIASLFRYLGSAFQCERIYIFEKNSAGCYDCVQEWCAEGIPHKKGILQGFTTDIVAPFYSFFSAQRNLVIRDMEELKQPNPELYSILTRDGLHSVMAGQLLFEGQDLGFMGIDNPSPECFDDLAVVFEVLGYYTAALLHSQRAINHLEDIGYRDRMTGCGNRHALFERVKTLLPQRSIAIAYIDVMDLKQTNDTQGHLVGDSMLTTVGHTLMEAFDSSEIFRMGGDEFLVLCQGIASDELKARLEIVRGHLTTKDIELAIGTVHRDTYSEPFSVLVDEADHLMYSEKNRLRVDTAVGSRFVTVSDAFSELIEIHPTSDRFKLLYSSFMGKSLPEGRFSETIQHVTDTYLHPDDREEFLHFWDPVTLKRGIEETSPGQNLSAVFRGMRAPGQWIKVQLEVIYFQDASGSPVLMCFVKNQLEETKQQTKIHSNDMDPVQTKTAQQFREIDEWLQETQPKYVVTFACDLNNFKLYNDIFGREAGDDYLKLFNDETLALAVKYNGQHIYLGGDNFCLIIPLEDIQTKKIEEQVNKHMEQVNFRDGFMPCVGVDISRDLFEPSTNRYDRALIAMGDVRGNFTNRVAFYDESRYRQQRNTQMLLMDASRGIRDGEFIFYLQPKMDMIHDEIVGAEALVRWKRNGQIISPNDFIDGMEKNGYIAALDRYIWEQTCKWLHSLDEQGITPLPVSVNMSRVDIHFIDVEHYLDSLIEKYQIKPEWLEIEITESAYTANEGQLNHVLANLRAKGFHVLMDDFGSGYSSLNMLQDAEIDVLKLDRHFLSAKRTPEKNIKLLETVFSMAKLLNLHVITEGVETKEQRDLLLERGEQYCQGFYYHPPMPVEDFEKLLTQQNQK